MINKDIDLDFGLDRLASSIIMVVGVGGAGGNAINHMYDMGIKDVAFMACNTDRQALNDSLVPIKVQLGEGLGAGNRPDKGRAAAIETLDRVVEIFQLEKTKMVFVTAGMGGGTGTGAAPIIAKAARDMGILTVGIVTMPYASEGPVRVKNAEQGIEEMRKNVDSLLVINNENIQQIYGELPITEAFGKANDILATAARGIAEIVTRPGIVNVDFADVTTVMKDSGIALMGSGRASGENRITEVAEAALASPLLNHKSIEGAQSILFNLTYGSDEVTLAESAYILDYIQSKAGENANIIWGAGPNEILGDDIELTIIATGFNLKDAKNTVKSSSGRSWRPNKDPFGGRLGGSADRGTMHGAGQGMEVIVIAENRKYANIDTILNTPAYVRRKSRLMGEVPAKAGQVRIKDANKDNSGNNSLF